MGLYLSDRETADLRVEIERLASRIAHLEAERDDYAQQISELFVLQQVFSTINSTLEPVDILSMVLRGVVEALKFKRVILFDVADGEIVRRLECDGDERVTVSADDHEFRPGSTLEDVASGALQLAYGKATDDDRPLDDTRAYYCLAPLVARNVVRGMLYADSPPGNQITESHLKMLLDFASQAAIAVENARLYEETRRLLEETKRLAMTDTLTGISNRRALNEMLERELATASRLDSSFAFVVMDLDDLKIINDSGGHGIGDQALRRFAQVLKRNARTDDIVARYAGDEFVLVMSQATPEQAEAGIKRILASLRQTGLTCSIGISMFPADGHDGIALFHSADQALYTAKQAGKNQYRFYRR